jgi:hypothetical protein
MEHWWNNVDRGKLKDSDKNLSQCHFPSINPTWNDVNVNPVLPGEEPVSYRMSYGTTRGKPTVFFRFYQQWLYLQKTEKKCRIHGCLIVGYAALTHNKLHGDVNRSFNTAVSVRFVAMLPS